MPAGDAAEVAGGEPAADTEHRLRRSWEGLEGILTADGTILAVSYSPSGRPYVLRDR